MRARPTGAIFSSALLLSFAIGGCEVIAGIPDFQDAPPATAGSGGTAEGGDGGMGGTPTCAPAADWTPQLNAVWNFDDAENLGIDSGSRGLTLDVGEDVESDADAIRGSGAGRVVGSRGFELVEDDLVQNTALTYGLWLHPTATANVEAHALRRLNPAASAGFLLLRSPVGRAACRIGNGSLVSTQGSNDAVLQTDAWSHVVCRIQSGEKQTLDLLFDGARDASQPYANPVVNQAGESLLIGGSEDVFRGSVDEAFITDGALSDGAVARIFACGIDGAGCCCNPESPSTYASCGRASSCGALAAQIACDTLLPPLEP